MRKVLAALVVMLAAAPAAPAADGEELSRLQGRWQRRATDERGKALVIVKEIKGTKERLTSFSEDGEVVYAHTVDFRLEKTDKVRVFTYFNCEIVGGPHKGDKFKGSSYIYTVDDQTLSEVWGFLIDVDAGSPRILSWTRVK
jgi:hypothetical protein